MGCSVNCGSHFSINTETRAISTPSGKITLMQYDHNSERLGFKMPQIVDGHDMLKCDKVEIQFINIDKVTKEETKGVYEVDDLKPGEDGQVEFSWLVSQNATQRCGILSFLVSFICYAEGSVELEYLWSTATFSGISINQGMDNGPIILEEYVDVLEKWRQDVFTDILKEVQKNYISKADITDKIELSPKIPMSGTVYEELQKCVPKTAIKDVIEPDTKSVPCSAIVYQAFQEARNAAVLKETLAQNLGNDSKNAMSQQAVTQEMNLSSNVLKFESAARLSSNLCRKDGVCDTSKIYVRHAATSGGNTPALNTPYTQKLTPEKPYAGYIALNHKNFDGRLNTGDEIVMIAEVEMTCDTNTLRVSGFYSDAAGDTPTYEVIKTLHKGKNYIIYPYVFDKNKLFQGIYMGYTGSTFLNFGMIIRNVNAFKAVKRQVNSQGLYDWKADIFDGATIVTDTKQGYAFIRKNGETLCTGITSEYSSSLVYMKFYKRHEDEYETKEDASIVKAEVKTLDSSVAAIKALINEKGIKSHWYPANSKILLKPNCIYYLRGDEKTFDWYNEDGSTLSDTAGEDMISFKDAFVITSNNDLGDGKNRHVAMIVTSVLQGYLTSKGFAVPVGKNFYVKSSSDPMSVWEIQM